MQLPVQSYIWVSFPFLYLKPKKLTVKKEPLIKPVENIKNQPKKENRKRLNIYA